MDNKIIIKDSFTMPAVDDTVNVIVSKSIGLTPECWIWNDSVGYLKVVKFSLYDNQVTLENVGRIENAKAGTLFPTCMEFLITAPAPIDLYNSMSTCLKADFNSPSVGNEALMSVESSYAISVDDQVIIDRTYRYLVTQVVNSTTLKVKNEGLGATGIIHVDCNECTPVQVVNQLNCCPIPTGDLTSNTSVLTVVDGEEVLLAPSSITLDTDLSQYDNSVSKFIDVNGVPRGTLSSNSSLVSVTNGTNNVLDNISLDLDTDLSKYNNTTSGYITLGDVPRGTLSSDSNLITVLGGVNNVLDNISLDLDTDLSKYDNSSSNFLATSDKKNLTSNTTVLTVINGTGTTLENTSLTLDTDLSQYDNSSSNFLATSDKKNLTSTSLLLTVANGTGAALENTSLSLNTDLSQYDNSVSKFVSVGGLPSGDITSSNSILTVTGGTGATLTNTLLTIDDDLSHYDNTTSAFITLGDVPALPSDTDLSHYDNSTSGFITSSSLPTVNDAKLTIYQSDGVTPFVEFTANASSAVTATLPAMTTVNDAKLTIYESDGVTPFVEFTANASSAVTATLPSSGTTLSYFEENLSGTTATFRPKNGSASTFNLGTSTDSYEHVYTNILNGGSGKSSYIEFSTDGGDTTYSNGSSSLYNAHAFFSGGKKLVAFAYSQAEYSTNVIPTTPNAYDIGGVSNTWANIYTNSLTLNGTTYTTIPGLILSGGVSMNTTVPYNTALTDTTYTSDSSTVNITNPYNRPITVITYCYINKAVLNISSGTGNNVHFLSRLLYNGNTENYQIDVTTPSAAAHATDVSCVAIGIEIMSISGNSTASFYWRHTLQILSHQGTVKNKQYYPFNYDVRYFAWFS